MDYSGCHLYLDSCMACPSSLHFALAPLHVFKCVPLLLLLLSVVPPRSPPLLHPLPALHVNLILLLARVPSSRACSPRLPCVSVSRSGVSPRACLRVAFTVSPRTCLRIVFTASPRTHARGVSAHLSSRILVSLAYDSAPVLHASRVDCAYPFRAIYTTMGFTWSLRAHRWGPRVPPTVQWTVSNESSRWFDNRDPTLREYLPCLATPFSDSPSSLPPHTIAVRATNEVPTCFLFFFRFDNPHLQFL